MASLHSKPVVGAGGGVYTAPPGTPEPATLSPIPAAYKNLGFIDDDGVSYQLPEDESEDMNVWQLAYPWDIVTVSQTSSVSFNLAQWTQLALQFVYSGGTFAAGTGSVPDAFTPPALTALSESVVLVTLITSAGNTVALWIPRGKVTEREEMNINRSEMSLLGVKVSVLGPSSGPAFKLLFTTGTLGVDPSAP